MKEHHFQYTTSNKAFIVALLIIATFILSELIGTYFKLNLILVLAISFFIAFLLFNKLKKRVVANCIAELSDTYLTLKLENNIKTVYFNDLTSYKAYYGRSGSAFYLKTKSEKLKISVNNNYCSTSNFDAFCKDTITQIKSYKEGEFS